MAGPFPGRCPCSSGAGTGRIDPWLGAGCQARPRLGRGRLDLAGKGAGRCLRSRAGGQPAPPPSGRRERAVGHRPGSRARSCRTSPPAGPGRPAGRAPPPTRPFLLSCFPAAPGRRPPWPAGRGPDLTRRAERSVRRRGPTDGPPPGTPTAPGRPAATPDAAPGTADDPLLTIDEVTAELRVSRAAFYRWRRQETGPPAVRLPGGGVRVRRSALTAWLRRLEEQDTQHGQE